MLLKRPVFIFFHIIFISFYVLFMFPSCSTVPSVESSLIHKNADQDTVTEPVEPEPDVSALLRPYCEIDTSATALAGETLPELLPPDSVSLSTGIEAVIDDQTEDMELLSPEPVQKEEGQENETPVKIENEDQAVHLKEEPAPVKNLTESEKKTEENTARENKKETKKEKKETTQKNQKEEQIRAHREMEAPHVNEIYTHMGEDIEISFNNNGWIFAGYIKDDDAKGVKYLAKDTTYRESLFTFKSIKTGSYDLEFILQDHTTGSQQREIVRVHVVEDTEFVPDNSADFITTNNLAEDFYNQGLYQHALEEYLKIYDEASPLLNEKIAELYERLGQEDSAVPYWESNLEREDDYSLTAAERLLSYSLDTGNTEKIVRYLDCVLRSGKIVPGSEILKIVHQLQKKQEYDEAISVMDNYLSLCSNSESRDAFYFLLGGLYESNSGIRDLKLAKQYYEKIISEYPAGSYVQPARKRLQYLNRHFFYIH